MKAIAAALLLGLAAPALAQPQPPPARAQPDADAFDAARALLATTDFEAQMEQSGQLAAQAALDEIVAAYRRQDVIIPPDLEARLRRIVANHIAATIDAIRPTAREDAARVYARFFTAEELRELTRLQANPVLVKAQAIMPLLMTELGRIGMAESIERLPALQQEMAAAIEAWLAETREPPRT